MLGSKNGIWIGGLVLMAVSMQPALAHNPSKSERWHRHGHVMRVDAPFTTVETRRWRTTAVDAPFTSVRADRRHGVWVRAPFVNLYVPR
jgi:hypothetical protein